MVSILKSYWFKSVFQVYVKLLQLITTCSSLVDYTFWNICLFLYLVDRASNICLSQRLSRA